jgi:copper(I)-binding protein
MQRYVEPSQPRRLPCSGLHPLLGSAPLAAQIASETFYVGAILIEAPWSWPITDGTRMVGGCVKITNIGRDPDRLVGGSTEVSGRFEVHRSSVADGVARMKLLTGGLEIRPGETVELRPDAVHAMLVDLRQELKRGDMVKGTLTFERAGTVAIRY